MKTKVIYRISAKREEDLPPVVGCRRISPTIVECTRDVDDVETIELFKKAYLRHVNNPPYRIHFFELEFTSTSEEKNAAELFHLRFRRVQPELGDEEETIYDTTGACPFCSEGTKQIGPMILPKLRPPPLPIFSDAAANVYLSSDRAVAVAEAGLTGALLYPVFRSHKATPPGLNAGLLAIHDADVLRSGPELNRRIVQDFPASAYQLIVIGTVDVADTVRFGSDPYFDEADETLCPLGHTYGRKLLSPLELATEVLERDFVVTRKATGGFGGLFRPRHLLITSARARKILGAANTRSIRWDPIQ